jgi:hypothetical protein
MNQQQRNATVSMGFLLAMISVGVGAYFWIERPFADRFLEACESVLKDRLFSPASYSRVKLSRQTIALTADEWVSFETLLSIKPDELEISQAKRGKKQPAMHKLFLTYDAANPAGVLQRLSSNCDYISRAGDLSNVSESSVVVDSLNRNGWLAQRIQNAQ